MENLGIWIGSGGIVGIVVLFFYMGRGFGKLETKLGDIDKRFDSIDKKFEMILLEIKEIRKELSNLDIRLSRLEVRVEERMVRVKYVPKTIPEHLHNLDEVKEN